MIRKFNNLHIEFLKKHYMGTGCAKLTKMFNAHFGSSYTESQITSLRYRHNLRSGLNFKIEKGARMSPDTEFKKGNIPWNKGRKGTHFSRDTEFKKGNKPKNTLPVGTIMMKTDGYIYKKIADVSPSRKGWKQLHRIVWEKAHGEIPPGKRVIFIDQDRTNVSLDNLMLASKEDLAQMNKKRLFSDDPLKNKINMNITRIKLKISKLEVSL